MKHRHSEMIKAKADNMDLVVFCKGNGKWFECLCDFGQIAWWEDCEYFLCLPQHNKNGQCLHWLNDSSSVQILINREWSNFRTYPDWQPDCLWMDDSTAFRIKPRKEKRWIGHFKSGNDYCTTQFSYKTIEQLKGSVHAPNGFDKWQFIEIEINVDV